MMEQVKETFGVIESYIINAGEGLKGPVRPVRHSAGFEPLDRACGGLPHADLSLMAARRSALAAGLARQMAVGAAVGARRCWSAALEGAGAGRAHGQQRRRTR